jgi:Uma2 family endonuclease
MAANPQTRISEQEYLELERAAEFRHEYYDGFMYAMSGGSWVHGSIVQNVSRLLDSALRARGCSVRTTDIRVRVSRRLYTYPDVLVVCGAPKFADDQKDTVLNPTLIIEVLSPSTERYDRGAKAAQYRTVESIEELAFVSQNEARVEVFRRRAPNEWVLSEFVGLESSCRFQSVGCELALSQIYESVTFTEPDGPGLL